MLKNVVTDHVKMSINPFDEIALEEAVRLHEANQVEEIIVASIGDALCQEQLRQGLAMGAHRALLIEADAEIANDPLCVAKILAAVVKRESCDLVMMGKQAIDNDCNQTGQMLAGLLQWPQATFASNVAFTPQQLTVSREVDAGTEVIEVSLPAVVTVDLRLNQPRYIALPNIMMAKSKPLESLELASFSLDLSTKLTRVALEKPKKREAGQVFTDVEAFLQQLDEAQLWG
jgi:electron transfer flavoprotein beta subunit